MSTVQISVTYGLGGFDADKPNSNIVEQVSATDVSGVWEVSTTDTIGTVTRTATVDEVARFEAQLNPPAEPVNPVVAVATAVSDAVDSAPNTVEGLKAAITSALAAFM